MFRISKLESGTIQINAVNLSNNICHGQSAIIANPSSSSNVSCLITYSSINSNEARYYTIISFKFNRNHEIFQSNIINNKASTAYDNGLIDASGPTNIKDCCIMNNQAKYIFRGKQQIILTNCSIDFAFEKNITGSVFIEKEAKTSFIIPIICTQKEYYCNASYDSLGDVIIPIDSEHTSNISFNFYRFLQYLFTSFLESY